MKNLIQTVVATTALLITTTISGNSIAQEVTLRLGTVDPQVTHSGVGAEKFAEEVSRLSNGTMEVKVFHAGQLGNIPTQISNVFSGAQDLHLIYPEFLGSVSDEAKVISLPYLFTDHDHLQKFYKSDLWQPMIETLDGQGAVILDKDWTWWILDPRGFGSIRAVYEPSDFDGLKMRIWEAKSAIETWKGFGTNPVVVPRPEMYLAFKQGIIEGGPETVGAWVDAKNVEHAKYWIRTDEYHQIINIMINKKKFETLTDEQKDILEEAMITAGETFRSHSQANFEQKKAIARSEYDANIIEPAIGPWRKSGAETIDRLIADGFVEADYVEAIRALDQ
ncbi:MAG: TRAP transporter substrate-binding protein [Rhizobiaceae bacterium]